MKSERIYGQKTLEVQKSVLSTVVETKMILTTKLHHGTMNSSRKEPKAQIPSPFSLVIVILHKQSRVLYQMHSDR